MTKKFRVSYLGMLGSYSYQAAHQLFPDAEYLGFRSFDEVVSHVENEDCDRAVIPVENSIGGRIPDVHNLLLTTNLNVRSEYMLEIRHCFATSSFKPDEAPMGKIKKIYSHPQGFIQCSKFLMQSYPDAEQIDASDMATAARILSESKSKDAAAITSLDAARFYKCAVFRENISDLSNNYTRFLTLSREPSNTQTSKDTSYITTIIFQVEHKPGSLRAALGAFEDNDINLVKLETYNLSEKTVRPTFYIDVGAPLNSPKMSAALADLQEKVTYIKLLGTYPASPVRSTVSGYLPVTN